MNLLEQLEGGLTVQGPEAMEALGQSWGAYWPSNTCLTLEGDLGTGKTTFMRGVGQGLGIERPITSPSFNLYLTYQGQRGNLLHLDAYRLHDGESLDSLMLDELLTTTPFFAVEWPSKIRDYLPTPRFTLTITAPNPECRHVLLKKVN